MKHGKLTWSSHHRVRLTDFSTDGFPPDAKRFLDKLEPDRLSSMIQTMAPFGKKHLVSSPIQLWYSFFCWQRHDDLHSDLCPFECFKSILWQKGNRFPPSKSNHRTGSWKERNYDTWSGRWMPATRGRWWWWWWFVVIHSEDDCFEVFPNLIPKRSRTTKASTQVGMQLLLLWWRWCMEILEYGLSLYECHMKVRMLWLLGYVETLRSGRGGWSVM